MPRRRTLLRIAAYLLLGLLTTAAIAFLCACFPPDFTLGTSAPKREPEGLFSIATNPSFGYSIFGWSHTPADAGVTPFELDRLRANPAPRIAILVRLQRSRRPCTQHRNAGAQSGAFPATGELGTGWPFIAFRALLPSRPLNSQPTPVPPWLGGIHVGFRDIPAPPGGFHRNPRIIPFHPVWPGLIADSALFALAWLALTHAARSARAALRRRRNHCERCNYDLRATPATSPCPECGHQHTAPR